jgi:hypothetical protein
LIRYIHENVIIDATKINCDVLAIASEEETARSRQVKRSLPSP